MSKINRIQQPYGYREQNDYISEGSRLCDAISSHTCSNNDGVVSDEAFVGVSYRDDLESFVFTNANNVPVGTLDMKDVKFSHLIRSSLYDKDEKKIKITFDNGDVIELDVPIEDIIYSDGLDLDENVLSVKVDEKSEKFLTVSKDGLQLNGIQDAIDEVKDELNGNIDDLSSSTDEKLSELDTKFTNKIDNVSSRLDDEITARESGDDAISSKLDEAKTNLEGEINEEKKARESSYGELDKKLNDEIEGRKASDEEIKKLLGDASDETNKSVTELIKDEATKRTEEISRIEELVSSETASRIEADEEINSKIDKISSNDIPNITNNVEKLQERIASEEKARESADKEIKELLADEVKNRQDEDKKISDDLANETATINAELGVIKEQLASEISNRESADTQLSSSITAETSSRQEEDSNLSAKIGTVENTLSSKISNEASSREEADNSLSKKIDDIKGDIEQEIANGKPKVIKITTLLPSNVKDAYQLVSENGDVLGETIYVYKDSSIVSIDFVDKDEMGHKGQYLKYTYVDVNGAEQNTYVNVSTLLAENEFKDGLTVNSATGVVSVKIDPISDEYLSVSSTGVKLSKVSDKFASITNSIDSLNTSFKALSKTVDDSLNEINKTVTSESNTRKDEDVVLKKLIEKESESRTTEVNRLDSRIDAENRALTQLNVSIADCLNTISGTVNTEIITRAAEDSKIKENVTATAATLNARIDVLASSIENETSERKIVDKTLQDAISTKANANDVYTTTVVDGKIQNVVNDTILREKDFATKVSLQSGLTEVASSVTDEAREREKKDAELGKSITSETASREKADNALSDRISSIENATVVRSVSNKDGMLDVDSTDKANVVVNVNTSSTKVNGQDNIIVKNNDGLFASANLSYDQTSNKLYFLTSNKEQKELQLKTKFNISSLSYDNVTKSITLGFVLDGEKGSVSCNIGPLVENIVSVSDSSIGAIKLSIDETNKISATTVVNKIHEDNALQLDEGGSLYVSSNRITEKLSKRIDELETRLAILESNSSASSVSTSDVSTQNISNANSKNVDTAYNPLIDEG